MRFLKFLAGLLLVPVCMVFAMTVYNLMGLMIEEGVNAGSPWRELPWLFGGFMIWLLIYYTLPPPIRTYVLGHELTHALWAYLTGGSVRSMHIGEDDGHVVVTRINFLVMLAPYFFPLYTMILVLAYGLLAVFVDTSKWQPLWLGLMGLTYSFHVTFTIMALSHQQSDVEENGKLFSYTVIIIMNLLLVALAMVATASPTLGQFVDTLSADADTVGKWIAVTLIEPLSE
jgi:hypothetical protein